MNKPYEIIGDKKTGRRVRVTGYHPMFDAIGVPIGYECDGASVPSCLRWLCGDPMEEPRVIAAIVHDWLYETHVVDRSVADSVYRRVLVLLGVPKWRANVEYAFVRAFGWRHWSG